jgi:hypothetical protein
MFNALGHEIPVAFPRFRFSLAGKSQYAIDLLPISLCILHQCAVAAVGIIVQCLHIFDQSGTKRINMDVPNEFAQVSLFL